MDFIRFILGLISIPVNFVLIIFIASRFPDTKFADFLTSWHWIITISVGLLIMGEIQGLRIWLAVATFCAVFAISYGLGYKARATEKNQN